MKVTIITNIPCLSGTLWGPNLSKYNAGPASSNLISQYKSDGKDEETVGELVFDNIPKGLYELRLYLPYFNHGQMFEMIVVMNKFIALLEDVTLTYKAVFQETLPEKVEDTSTV